MLKKTVTYTNLFTKEPVTEDLYFHISKADLIRMEVEFSEDKYTPPNGEEEFTGMRAHFSRISNTTDIKIVMKEFEALLQRAYGKKDGDRFIKNEPIWNEFYGSEAYSELIFQMLKNPEEAASFFAGVIPADIEQEAAQIAAAAEAAGLVSAAPSTNNAEPTAEQRLHEITEATPENPVTLTQAEITTMDSDALRTGLASGQYKLS